MPPPSPGKCRGPVVRQLSLQNPTPPQAPAARGPKKQLSEDGGRDLEPVEVTGQGWNVGSERPRVRVNSGGGKVCQPKVAGARPKPVKVAWADAKPERPGNCAGVEVIATKCQGQPRPASLKTQRLRSPLLGNKDTLVYTRLQLAERLRNAWSEREKMKPNINIFLARAPETTRSESEAASDGARGGLAFQDAASTLSDTSAPLDKKRKSMRVRAFTLPETKTPDPIEPDPPEEEDPAGAGKSEENEFPGRHLQELNKIEIRVTKIEAEAEGLENRPPDGEEQALGTKRSRNKECDSFSDGKEEGRAAESPPVTAQDRRANFRRSGMLNKTITESFSSAVEEKDGKVPARPPQKKPPLIRTFSAPGPSDQPPHGILQKTARTALQKRLQPTVSFDIPGTEDARGLKDRIKSAPIRRRLKSAAARRKGKDTDSSDEEKEAKEPAANAKKTFKRSQLKKGGDIVTMVSLVSPAESDTEDSVINLPMESWTGEDRAEPPQDCKTASGNADDSAESSAAVQKFVSLRKMTKSVTFHPHPILGRSYSASFPSRRAPAGTPVVVPAPVVGNPALTPAQMSERDKRIPPFSVGYSAPDGRGIKRKLLRSSSESTKDDDASEVDEKGTETAGPSENSEAIKGADDGGDEKGSGEPDFKCPKERECWNLYQKMMQKGVSVSFDTVLRGMLTPTEYRLRKNQLLNC